ncbi:hypothetical protein NMY22_g11660 [Coprinellus aureogranulatus]|nr:hypothetical protein NMY22_g11660 [Coprinellus aureogranulatus]
MTDFRIPCATTLLTYLTESSQMSLEPDPSPASKATALGPTFLRIATALAVEYISTIAVSPKSLLQALCTSLKTSTPIVQDAVLLSILRLAAEVPFSDDRTTVDEVRRAVEEVHAHSGTYIQKLPEFVTALDHSEARANSRIKDAEAYRDAPPSSQEDKARSPSPSANVKPAPSSKSKLRYAAYETPKPMASLRLGPSPSSPRLNKVNVVSSPRSDAGDSSGESGAMEAASLGLAAVSLGKLDSFDSLDSGRQNSGEGMLKKGGSAIFATRNPISQWSPLGRPAEAATPNEGTSSTAAAAEPDNTTPDSSEAANAPSTAPAPTPTAWDESATDNGPNVSQTETGEAAEKSTTARSKRKPVKLNLHTIKFHMLGHYVPVIKSFGPTDLYSSEWGENFHRSPKAWFKQTSKRNVQKEMTWHERRRARLQRAKRRILLKKHSPKALELQEQQLASRNFLIPYYIGPSKASPIWLADFAVNGRFSGDVAASSFIRDLKMHLLPRYIAAVQPDLSSPALDELIAGQDWSQIVLNHDRFYAHKIMRIKYTTYDARRAEDIIHLDTDQCNAILLDPTYSRATSSGRLPFRYCKVIGILHAEVGFVGDIGRCGNEYVYHPLEFLWVRWYTLVDAVEPGSLRLDRLRLIPVNEPNAFSFIDPILVVRSCHLIPQFGAALAAPDGKSTSQLAQDGKDWPAYFVNKFADRDTFMRYEWGLAVGHTYTHGDAILANEEILARQRERDRILDGRRSSNATLGETPQTSRPDQSLQEPSATGATGTMPSASMLPPPPSLNDPGHHAGISESDPVAVSEQGNEILEREGLAGPRENLRTDGGGDGLSAGYSSDGTGSDRYSGANSSGGSGWGPDGDSRWDGVSDEEERLLDMYPDEY